jgi:two-component system response regulator VicR
MAAARILIADDDEITARFLTSLLESEGYEVLVAEDGDQALVLARDGRPDLILCDLVMPYRDGFEVLRDLREAAPLTRVPVIILSMKDREEDIVRGLEEGAEDYVIKPFHARELLVRIRKHLRRARERR